MVDLSSLDAKLDDLLGRSTAPARFLNLDSAADYSGISVESIRRLVSGGKLTALRPVRGRIVLDRIELDAYVLSCTQRPRTGRGRR